MKEEGRREQEEDLNTKEEEATPRESPKRTDDGAREARGGARRKRLTGFHGLTLQKKPPAQSPRLHLRELRGRLRSLQPCATGSGSLQPRALTVWQETSLNCRPASHHLEHCAGSSQVGGRRGQGPGRQRVDAIRGRQRKAGYKHWCLARGGSPISKLIVLVFYVTLHRVYWWYMIHWKQEKLKHISWLLFNCFILKLTKVVTFCFQLNILN